MSRVADIFTIAVVFFVALVKGILWILPWRRGDLVMRLALGIYSVTFAVFWGLALVRTAIYSSIPLPDWFVWVLRVVLSASGIIAIIQMNRARGHRTTGREETS